MFGELDESKRPEGGVTRMTDAFTGWPGHRLLFAPAGRRPQLQRGFVRALPQMTSPPAPSVLGAITALPPGKAEFGVPSVLRLIERGAPSDWLRTRAQS